MGRTRNRTQSAVIIALLLFMTACVAKNPNEGHVKGYDDVNFVPATNISYQNYTPDIYNESIPERNFTIDSNGTVIFAQPPPPPPDPTWKDKITNITENQHVQDVKEVATKGSKTLFGEKAIAIIITVLAILLIIALINAFWEGAVWIIVIILLIIIAKIYLI